MNKFALILLINIIQQFYFSNSTIFRFKNLECEVFDNKSVAVKHCRLRVMGRDRVAVDFYLNVLQIPVDNITVSRAIRTQFVL